VPRYIVVAHKRVMKLLALLGEEALKERIKEIIKKLVDYPLSLRELDVEKLEGAERTFRVRIGRYRLIFHVDKKERTIFVTHLGKRESIYES
jgi:mRNA-degrading endonuclease RelE of RelBE toxin-antitoxin system